MKFLFWFMWSITTLLSLIYVGTGLATFNNVAKTSVSSDFKSLKYGMLGSCFLGFLMVLYFCVLSVCVNMTNTTNPWHYNIHSEVGWGMMLGSAMHMIFFMLLAGLALHSGDAWARNNFGESSMKYQTLRVAYAFAYILAVAFFAMSLAVMCSYSQFNYGASMFMGGPRMGAFGATVPMAAVADTRFMPTMGMGGMPGMGMGGMATVPAYPGGAMMAPMGYPPVGYPMA